MEKIDERIYRKTQSWHYECLVQDRELLIRSNIRRDAYDHQSYANLETWTPVGWKVVVSLPITQTPAKSVNYTVDKERDIYLDLFQLTANDLFDIYLKIQDSLRATAVR